MQKLAPLEQHGHVSCVVSWRVACSVRSACGSLQGGADWLCIRAVISNSSGAAFALASHVLEPAGGLLAAATRFRAAALGPRRVGELRTEG